MAESGLAMVNVARPGQEVVEQQAGLHHTAVMRRPAGRRKAHRRRRWRSRRDLQAPVEEQAAVIAQMTDGPARRPPRRSPGAQSGETSAPRSRAWIPRGSPCARRSSRSSARSPRRFLSKISPSATGATYRSPAGGIHLTGEVQQRFGRSSPTTVCNGGAEAGGQLPNLAHLWCGNPGETVAAHHVHDHQLGAGLRRDSGMPGAPTFRTRAPPVTATTTPRGPPSRVICWRPGTSPRAVDLSASHSRASSRSAVRLPRGNSSTAPRRPSPGRTLPWESLRAGLRCVRSTSSIWDAWRTILVGHRFAARSR